MHDVTRSRLDDKNTRAVAAAVVGGLAAAGITVLAFALIASGGQYAPARAPLAGPAAAGPAAAQQFYRPHPVYHLPRAARPMSRTGDAARQPAGSVQQASAPARSSGTSASGLPQNWERLAARNGAPLWALKMVRSFG